MYVSKGVFCRVRVHSVGYEILYRIYRIIGYRYESLTETTERSGTGMRILQKLQNLSGTVRYGTVRLQKTGTGSRVLLQVQTRPSG